MIHEEICTYEVCKLAKEKGFPQDDWSCFGDMNHRNGVLYNDKEEHCIAPTLSLLEYWLSMVSDFRIHVWEYNNDKYVWKINSQHRGYGYGGFRGFSSPVYFSSYELALEDALKFALENLGSNGLKRTNRLYI